MRVVCGPNILKTYTIAYKEHPSSSNHGRLPDPLATYKRIYVTLFQGRGGSAASIAAREVRLQCGGQCQDDSDTANIGRSTLDPEPTQRMHAILVSAASR